jgi:uncharacterized C2H2 Zn-finger protein
MSIPIWQQQVDRELDRVRTASNHYDNIVQCRVPPHETLRDGTIHLRCPDCGMERSCPRSEWLRTHDDEALIAVLVNGSYTWKLVGPLGASAGISWRRFAQDAFKAEHVFNRCRALRAKGLL